MNAAIWLAELAAELHRRGVAADAGAARGRRGAAHLRDGGENPPRAFGPPEQYAAAVVESLGAGAHGRRRAPSRRARSGCRRGDHQAVRAANRAARRRPDRPGRTDRGRRRRERLRQEHLPRICAGLVSARRRRVTVTGRLGYCPQDGGTVDFLRPDEHFVLVGAGAGHGPRGTARARPRRGRRRSAGAAADAPTARHLSGGTRQKLNLVMSDAQRTRRAAARRAVPGLRPGHLRQLLGPAVPAARRGQAIVVVTHLLNQLDGVDVVLDLTGVDA